MCYLTLLRRPLLALLPLLCLAAISLVPTDAYAQDNSPQFGGCLAGGDVCLGPSASITVGEFNLSTSKFAGGVIPGIGYGATYRPNEWYATGAALYLSFLVGQGQPNQAIPTVMFSSANYVRLGGWRVRHRTGRWAGKEGLAFVLRPRLGLRWKSQIREESARPETNKLTLSATWSFS